MAYDGIWGHAGDTQVDRYTQRWFIDIGYSMELTDIFNGAYSMGI